MTRFRHPAIRLAAAVVLAFGLTSVVAASSATAGGQAPAGHRLGASSVQADPATAAANQSLTTALVGAPAAAAAVPTADPCGFVSAVPADSFKGIPVFDPVQAAKPYTATVNTTQGTFAFKALTDKAPCTTYSFRFLAEKDYYKDTHCHRLTTQRIYVLQCGDPTGTGSGGPGYSFNDENLTGATYPAGTVAMANAGPNTNGSQFFICWQDTKLRPNYTPFGVITSGLDVLQKIAAAGEDDQNGPGDGFPTLPVNFRFVHIHAG